MLLLNSIELDTLTVEIITVLTYNHRSKIVLKTGIHENG